MNSNQTLDAICKSILHLGMISLKEAALQGDIERCRVEVQHLHNLPSLIGDGNYARHLYYFQFERKKYRQWVSSLDNAHLKDRVEQTFAPLWNAMAAELFKIFPELKPVAQG